MIFPFLTLTILVGWFPMRYGAIQIQWKNSKLFLLQINLTASVTKEQISSTVSGKLDFTGKYDFVRNITPFKLCFIPGLTELSDFGTSDSILVKTNCRETQ